MKKIRTGGFKDWRNQRLEKSRSEEIWNWETKYFRNPGLLKFWTSEKVN
nr:hypothetical protein [uncultured Prevotella sp.]